MSLIWSLVGEPLSYAFMQRALAAAALIGAVSAVLSCYLVLRGWSLMGDAISHAVLPGIVLAFAAGLPLSLGAFAAGLTSVVGLALTLTNLPTGVVQRSGLTASDLWIAASAIAIGFQR